jgi:UPF0755 protein
MARSRVKDKSKSGRWLLASGLIVLAAMVGCLAAYMLIKPAPNVPVTVSVKPGFSSGDVADTLAAQGVIKNALLFKLYIKQKGEQDRLQAGEYRMKTGMSYAEALDLLVKGPKIKYYTLVIPEGFTVDDIAGRVAADTPIKKDDFLAAAVRSKYDFGFLKDVAGESLEGYLFPKTYTVTDKTRAKDLVRLMLQQFEKETSVLDLSFAKKRGMTLGQIVIIASIIEKEVKIPSERTLVAAVIYNRLDQDMLLQLCATVEYSLPEHKESLSYKDLETESPYNTYLHPGLPPGPIASPGLACLQAALNPSPVDYLYYVLTGDDGSHSFTNSYEEFLKIKNEKGL